MCSPLFKSLRGLAVRAINKHKEVTNTRNIPTLADFTHTHTHTHTHIHTHTSCCHLAAIVESVPTMKGSVDTPATTEDSARKEAESSPIKRVTCPPKNAKTKRNVGDSESTGNNREDITEIELNEGEGQRIFVDDHYTKVLFTFLSKQIYSCI